jgi:putative ATP-dependent endonuclease of OLD family
MHVCRLYIAGYRSIKELDLSFKPGKNVVVGRNNAGKSNIVKAINLVLGDANPTYQRSETFTESDLHTWREILDEGSTTSCVDEAIVWVELARAANENLDYKSLYNGRGFYRFGGSFDGNLASVKDGQIAPDASPKAIADLFGEMEPDPNPRLWISAKASLDSPLEREFGEKIRFALLFRACQLGSGEIEKHLHFLYRGDDGSGWRVVVKAPYRNELLQSAIIPSFRDPASQLRPTSWTWYGKLLRHLTTKPVKAAELAIALKGVKVVADELFQEVRTELGESTLNVAFPGTELHFQLHADIGADLYKGTVIYADDGCKSPLQDKGAGIQSATIIGLFTYYVKHVNVAGSALLCVEEPELFLHPHARRVISNRLDEFAEDGQNQVILTTHSPEFARSTKDDLNLTLVKKEGGATSAIGVPFRHHRRILITPQMAEIFFAEKAIFVEGHDEFLLRLVAEEVFRESLDAANVSIIQVTGKDHFKQMVKLALKLGIGAHIMCDLDFLLRDQLAEGRAYGAKPHPDLSSLGKDFFAQPCTLSEEGEAVLSEIQKIRSSTKKKNEKGFYTATHLDELPEVPLTDLVKRLRNNGVCVLDGEIEHLFKDQTLCAPSTNKFTMETASKIHERLAKGSRLEDLLELEPLVTFLNGVLAH